MDPPPPIEHHSDWLPLSLVSCLLLVSVLFALSRYGNIKSQPWYVSLVCTIGWFLPFWIVFLLPLDLASVSLLCFISTYMYSFLAFVRLFMTTNKDECLLHMFRNLSYLLLGELVTGQHFA